MSEIGLNINVDSYNNEGIKTIKGNNNAEIYKLYILKNKRRLSLVGKTVKLGYVMAGTTNGDVIENLNITNAEQGEITFPITNRISKQDGVYSCQLAIYGADGFLEHTATFGLTVEANIFTKIAGEIADSKDFTYLENILDKASKLSEKLKENTATATNANSNLESNITEANNINSKLLENTSTATSLNKNLESNIDLAKEVKETIKDLDTKNIEATEKIQTLTGLNSKAEELSNNINKGLPLNSELIKNVESAKTANNELIATNNDAKAKKTDLDNSLEEAKKYISGLDGSKNPVQMQLDIDMLKNGLKSNQALAYKGSSISANDTLEGRTEGMRIGGRTLNNLLIPKKANLQGGWVLQDDNIFSVESDGNGFADIRFNDLPIKPNTNYTCYIEILENTLVGEGGISVFGFNEFGNGTSIPYNSKGLVQVKSLSSNKNGFYFGFYKNSITSGCLKLRLMLIEGNNNNTINYFEGLKSFGETEKVGDKYKISILSNGKNLYKGDNIIMYKQEEKWRVVYIDTPNFEIGKFYKLSYSCNETAELKIILTYANGHEGYISSLDSIHIESGKGNVVKVRLYIEDSVFQTNKKFVFSNIQIEEGTQSTPYEPYKENKKDILIKEPLRSVGDVYDVMYEYDNKIMVEKNIGKIKIDGRVAPVIFSQFSTNTHIAFYISVEGENNYGLPVYPDKAFAFKGNGDTVLCDKFKISANTVLSDISDEAVCLVNASPNYVGFKILKSKIKTGDITYNDIKEYLKENPATVYYQKAEPTIEIVENCVDIDLDTFGEKTYFNILNSLPGTLDFKVPSNIGSSLQNLAKEVNNIWDVINNLLVPGILDVNKKVALATIKNNLK
ncbi:BppU family phage baseplate upper protein [Clostridium perfringens]|nr:BppU family phage baseplate upper protein [Clostridium perfringens]